VQKIIAAALVASVLWLSALPVSAQSQVSTIDGVVRQAISEYHLKSLIVQVRANGTDVYTAAFGESMAGVPATSRMHFRNGAMAFTYMSTLLLELADRKKISLDTRLSQFRPDLPHAGEITMKNLANMTSGYADYVYQREVLHGVNLNPFRQWTPEELIAIGVGKPMMFDPGTNWGYSHTNYVILGEILEKVAGMPLNDAMRKYVFRPMGLTQTNGSSTPQMPEPVLHAFSSERREALQISPDLPFYEESTYWNPSWTTFDGAVQTTDIADMSKSMEAVGTGKLLTAASHAAQVSSELVGFGHPTPDCGVCSQNTMALHYGLGVVLLGPWIGQDKSFSGSSATVGYLPSKHLTIAVEVTYLPEAFNSEGGYKDRSVDAFKALANALAPGTLPASP
jgi:CubicO group peptidase (beta-lactamase class C family)